ncbi:SKI/DACH domain-containing protein 1 [Chanos chanos]|uniref:SKI/DACH domain-containing protein 1 n=1 Tax=Chanos chanos TaxID=29144 RepID=A0A6J2V4C8_CHACN|nr:SKI/DACH domain-containing protein 1 [Chanos chanos]
MSKMGDLESGFEEMQGVKLGYLVIKGKQMFALSQVFTDLLKNIPRTTVHKRMDHLNVKKHHCDLEELRKLKAINSIAFHAAKCTLISREDVEALYFSCKTERILKSNKRKVKTHSSDNLCDSKIRSDSRGGFWKEKVWLSLHGVPQTFSFKNKTARQEVASRTESNLPQFYSKSFCHDFQPVTKSACKPFKNYETTQIPSNCVAYNQKHSFFRNAVTRQPVLYQSAIAAQPQHPGNADLLYKRKRKRESIGRQFWSRSRRNHQVLVVPKCCKSKTPNGSISKFHLEHDLYLDHRHIGHFQESCSSDTESSSYSERMNNDSDFGSSLSTSSNSGTSDDEEDDSFSDSSDVSTDEESSSQSDSSSVSSQVSLQSIRFRRAGFSNLNTKAPLVLQPTFHYNQHRTPNHGSSSIVDYDRAGKQQKLDFTASRDKLQDSDATHVRKFCPPVLGNSFMDSGGSEVSESVLHLEFRDNPKTSDPVTNRIKKMGLSPGANGNKAFPQQRISGHANKCPQALIPHCAQDKETMGSKSSDNNLSLAANSKREAKISHCLKLPSPLKPIKTEAEECNTATSSNNETTRTVKTPPFLLNNVKIKIEDTFDEYEYASQGTGSQCLGIEADTNKIQCLRNEIKETDHLNHASEAAESCASVPIPPLSNQESKSTLKSPSSDEADYKNGARVRKNYRTLVLGKKADTIRTQSKSAKVDRSPRSTGNFESYEGSSEDWTGASKRKRANNNVASLKKPFNFMANFPSLPSLIIGSDGDLSPAYSLNSLRNNQLPHRSHPVWRWQLGGSVVPPPPSQKFRKSAIIP